MSSYDSPSLPRQWVAGIGLLYALFLAYSLLILQRFLLGVFLGTAIGFLYLLWRFLVAFETIANALQRLARQRESSE